MTWFKVGDELTFHPRVTRAGNAAIGLWTRAGTWCSEHLTDGWISHDDARALGSAAEIKRLVTVGLWYEEAVDGRRGYRFHRWATNGLGDKRQPTRAEIEAEREKTRVRVQRWRERKAAADHEEPPPEVTTGNGVTEDDVTPYERVAYGVSPHDAPTRPDPTRPDHSPSESVSRARRAHPLPADWEPNEKHREYAGAHRIDLAVEAQKFRDHHAMKGTLGKDWDAGFRNWLARAVEYRDERNPQQPSLRERYRGTEL